MQKISAGKFQVSPSGRAIRCGRLNESSVLLFPKVVEEQCRLLAVRPEGANHQWKKNPPRELSIDLEADERLGRATGRLEPRDKGRFRRLSNPAGRNVSEA